MDRQATARRPPTLPLVRRLGHRLQAREAQATALRRAVLPTALVTILATEADALLEQAASRWGAAFSMAETWDIPGSWSRLKGAHHADIQSAQNRVIVALTSGDFMVFAIIIAIFGIALFFYFTQKQSERLADPLDHSTVYLDDLLSHIMLENEGPFILHVYRQSGNIHADSKVFATRDAALASALSTFKRAQIDAVSVQQNTSYRLNVTRAFFDHRGKAEGKKVGGFEIVRA